MEQRRHEEREELEDRQSREWEEAQERYRCQREEAADRPEQGMMAMMQMLVVGVVEGGK